MILSLLPLQTRGGGESAYVDFSDFRVYDLSKVEAYYTIAVGSSGTAYFDVYFVMGAPFGMEPQFYIEQGTDKNTSILTSGKTVFGSYTVKIDGSNFDPYAFDMPRLFNVDSIPESITDRFYGLSGYCILLKESYTKPY